jgi:drug/metabolite transporter (DMT)-like permease
MSDVLRGRWLIVAAAVLWSLSGFFARLFTTPTWLHLHEPSLTPFQMAVYRNFFAGLMLLPLLRMSVVRVRPVMFVMVAAFAGMSGLYLAAMNAGPAVIAGLLQYTAPGWMVVGCVWLLREPLDRPALLTILGGLLGVSIIVLGQADGARLTQAALALGSGVMFAIIMLCLRVLRTEDAGWLTVWNHLGAALLLCPLVWAVPVPTGPQLLALAVFGAVQMALPYWLMARGLRSVSPQEAGALTLIEPLLIPMWAMLIAPDTEWPDAWTWAGGACILGTLFLRYCWTPTATPTRPAVDV